MRRKSLKMSKHKQGTEPRSKLELLTRIIQQQQNGMALLLRADSLKNRGDLNAATQAYDQLIATEKQNLDATLAFNENNPNPAEISPVVQRLLNALFIQADVVQARGNPTNAETLRNEAQALAREYFGTAGTADAQRRRAASLIDEARFNEALVALANARDLFQGEGDILKVARTALDQVNLLQWLGDYERALTELNRAAEIAAPLRSGEEQSSTDFFKTVSALLSEQTIPMSDLPKVKAIADRAELNRIAVELDYYRGLIHKFLGHYDEAAECFKKVLPAYEALGNGAGVEAQLGAVLIGKEKYDEALAMFTRLEPHFREGGLLRPKLAVLLKAQAEALFHLGQPADALRKLEEGIKDFATYYDPDSLWKLQWLQGRVLASSGKKEAALQTYAAAAATVDSLRKAPLGYRLDSTYLKDKLPLFQDAITLACEIQDADKCCELMEMVKSRILTSTLSIPVEQASGQAQPFEKEFDDLTKQLDALEYNAYSNGWNEPLQNQRQSLLARRADLLERIRFSDPRWRTMTAPVPFDLSQVANTLSVLGHAALSLFYLGDRVIAVLVKDGKRDVAQVQLAPDVKSNLDRYVKNLQAKNFKPAWFDLSAGLGVEAHHLVPRELLESALQAKQLIIVPHGSLHLVAWAGMIFKGQRLFEYCPVGVLPNLSCVLHLKHDMLNQPPIALIGAPDYGKQSTLARLPFTQAEIERIRDAYAYVDAGRIIGEALIGSQATEENFWRLAKDERASGAIFHIACHGTFESEEPLYSGLLMSDAQVDAAEIARTALKFQQVVLSACSTGYRPTQVQGVELAGDDILGLPGAFLEAGAQSVLVSIPKAADDATFQFMVTYHGYRLDGKSPLAALQETQRAMLTDAHCPPPTWIGFTVYGCQ